MSVLTSAPTLMPAVQTASQAPSMVSRMTMIMEAFEPQDARLLLASWCSWAGWSTPRTAMAWDGAR